MDKHDFIFNTAEGVLAVDRDQRIVLWNEAAQALLGFPAKEVLGKRCYEVIGGRDESGRLVCHLNCPAMMTVLRQELVPTRDLLVRTKAGREVWVSASTLLIPSRRRDLGVMVHLLRDASRQKEMERLVQQLVSGFANLASSPASDPPTTPPLLSHSPELTSREKEVLRLLCSGGSTQAIAKRLCISPFTARNHIQKILAKLKVHSRLEAATLALRNGLL